MITRHVFRMVPFMCELESSFVADSFESLVDIIRNYLMKRCRLRNVLTLGGSSMVTYQPHAFFRRFRSHCPLVFGNAAAMSSAQTPVNVKSSGPVTAESNSRMFTFALFTISDMAKRGHPKSSPLLHRTHLLRSRLTGKCSSSESNDDTLASWDL